MRESTFTFVAGHVALELVNTVDWRGDPSRRRDLLDEAADLLSWGQQAGLLGASEARALSSATERDARAASRVLGRARRLRETLARMFAATAHGRHPAARDLRHFNAWLGAALRRRRLAVRGGVCEWVWLKSDEASFDALFHPIVLAAADLLASVDRTKVRPCASEACGWLFLDTSRNGARRWCMMQGCGNRAKARRFYQRSTTASA